MSVRFYDEALYNKIKKWIVDPNLLLLNTDDTTRLFQITNDINNDKPLTLPLISIRRDREFEITSFKKQPRSFNGFVLKSNEDINIPINVVPIRINYEIDIYTRLLSEADDYVRDFIFKFINNPRLTINVEYNGCQIQHNSTIYLDSNVIDNSDIKEKLFADQFQRFTLRLTVEDAYLFSLPERDNAKLVSAELDVEDRTTKEIVETDEIFD